MLRQAVIVLSALTTLLPSGVAGSGPDPGHCAVIDGAGRCLVAAADPARPGGPTASPPPAKRAPHAPAAASSDDPPSPTILDVPIAGGGWVVRPIPQLLLPGTRPPAGVPAALARRAIELLRLPRPALQTSAPGRVYVGMPVWLWVEGGKANVGPISATATTGASRVTATARLTQTVWGMGPTGAVVRCPGPGTPWNGQHGPSPDCGYVFSERSLPHRTGGSGRWMVTVTGVWQVVWNGVSGGLPVAGTQVVTLAATQPMAVGELQVLLGSGET